MTARPATAKKRKNFDTRVSVSLSQETHARLSTMADHRQISVGAILREAILEYLATRPASKKTTRGTR